MTKPILIGGCFRFESIHHWPVIRFFLSGTAYGLIEVIWRGYTHPSMVLTGGACFAMICAVNRRYRQKPLLLRSAACAVGITGIEFCVGLLVNRVLRMDVWDYSDMLFHLMGQICPLYSFLWFLLCIPVSYALSRPKFPRHLKIRKNDFISS